MNKNFEFDTNVSVLLNNMHLDLHNNYYLTDISYTESKTLSVTFHKRQEEWVKDLDPYFIKLDFYNVYYLELSSMFFHIFPKSVEEIGYKEPNDFDLDWLISNSLERSQNHLIIRFEEDEYLRIYCSSICASI